MKSVVGLGHIPHAPLKLSDYVYQALEQAIIRREVLPGTRIVEGEVASRLQVSTTPVREALNRLAREGLVVINPHKGAWVRELSPVEVAEIYDVREALEVKAVQLACSAATDDDVRLMKQALEAAERALVDNDIEEYRQEHDRFHDLIIKASGNTTLMSMMKQIKKHLGMCISSTIRFPGRPLVASREHKTILEAIEQRNEDTAGRLMSSHIRGAKNELMKRLSN